MEVNIDSFLDNRNKELWVELTGQLRIDVEYHSHSWYAGFSQNDTHIVYVPIGITPDPAGFTHELLHIDLRRRELELPAGIKFLIWGKPSISMCFSDDLVEHMINCFNHIKMLPYFLELGYDRSGFIYDFTENKFTDVEVQSIIANYYNKATDVYNSIAIDYYIAKYIAAKACPNTSFNYSKNFQLLNNLDPKLFLVLEKFYNDWLTYDKNKVSIIIDPHSIASDFVDNMDKWSNGKVII
jgi:hypothetical protein